VNLLHCVEYNNVLAPVAKRCGSTVALTDHYSTCSSSYKSVFS